MKWVGLLVLGACGGSGGDTDDAPPTNASYADNDRDGYIASVDCDDDNPAVNPGQDEVCNTIDDDCDGRIDADAVDGMAGFVDADGDQVGSDVPLVSCTVPGWAPTTGDCDDADATRFPGAPEVCNGVDDNCDLRADEGAAILDDHYDTLAAAILAAEDGDVVVLCDGITQAGGLVIDDAITITSASGDPALTVIDGTGASASVFVVDGGDLTLDGLTVKDGAGTFATLVDGQAPALAGGAVNALVGAGGPVTVRNCVLSGNSARGGGAIAGAVVTIEDSTLVGNSVTGAAPGEGGAVWIAAEGTFAATRTLFEANSATGGGALSVHAPTTLTDVEAFENSALGNGGFAIAQSIEGATRVTVSIVGGSVHDNLAGNNAGALWMVDADGTADGATVFTANSGVEGGALELFAQIVGGPVVSWSGGTFTDNIAESVGGAIITQAGTASAELSNLVIMDNVADNQGGGLTLRGNGTSATTIRDSLITGNQSFGGGGISILNNAEIPPMVLERVEIADNVSFSTGGAMVVFFSEVDLVDSVIRDNVAQNGGGLWMDARPIVRVTSSDFPGNLPEDVWFVQTSEGVDLPDTDATLVCTGADGTCL